MKIDLVKSLKENELYLSALKNLTDEERIQVTTQTESMMSDLSNIVQAFVNQVKLSDDETQRDFKTEVDDSGLVIHEISQTSGSHG